MKKRSGFALRKIINLEVNVNKFRFGNHVGSSYIELPIEISRKHACINVIYPVERHVDIVTSYPNYKDVLNVEGIELPMAIEEINPNISVKVYILELIQLKLNM